MALDWKDDATAPLSEAPVTVEKEVVSQEMLKAQRYFSVFNAGPGRTILDEGEKERCMASSYIPQNGDAGIDTNQMIFNEGKKQMVLEVLNYLRIAEEG